MAETQFTLAAAGYGMVNMQIQFIVAYILARIVGFGGCLHIKR